MNKTLLAGALILLAGMAGAVTTVQGEINQTQQVQQEDQRIPDAFYAFDAEGGYILIWLNDQGQVNNVFGTVGDVNQLETGSVVACEYYLETERLLDLEDPSESICYGYDELQQRISGGAIPYLPLNQTEQPLRQGFGDDIDDEGGTMMQNQTMGQ